MSEPAGPRRPPRRISGPRPILKFDVGGRGFMSAIYLLVIFGVVLLGFGAYFVVQLLR